MRGDWMISYEPFFETLKAQGITSYRLMKMGFPRSNYYAIKRGDNINSYTVNHLCKLLHCDVCDIMRYVEDPKE
jgi:DNA-binding Xre family transcriptional regulator